MRTHTRSTIAMLSAVAVAFVATPTASAEPTPSKGGSIVDVTKLPLAATAKWQPVLRADAKGGSLRLVGRCRPDYRSSGGLQPERSVPTAFLRSVGDAGGWRASVSAAQFRDHSAAQKALTAYRKDLQPCMSTQTGAPPAARNAEQVQMSLDFGSDWGEVFAVVVGSRVVESVYVHPKPAATGFGYNSAEVFRALRALDAAALEGRPSVEGR